ncbi:hypothetical protein [Halobacillus andaensis]|uniref:hypothetical protein n=1 Tax=Halobacillus andaensis TaxID=1176239 RepID=UPI003D717653
MSLISLIVPFLMILITMIVLFDSAKNGITPTPTTSKEKTAALKISETFKPDSIADLGAGFGTMAFPLAKQFPNSRVVAYETAALPWIFLLIRSRIQPRPNLTVRRRNFMKEDLSKHDLLYTYLYPKAMDQLQEKINHTPVILISNFFQMPGWKPSLIWPVESRTRYSSSIYLYRRNG